jgi:spermidine/putrescine transport system permease protein
VVIAYLFLPIAVMILFGFNDYRGRFNFTWEGFTLRWYRNLLDFPELTLAIKNSLTIAAISTLIATILGTLVALALTRYRFRGRSAMNLFVFVPMASPEIVVAHIMFSISYVVVTVKARTSNFDVNLEDAAQDLGASPWITFWTVTFPLIFPGILAAGMLATVLSIDDYVITSFNAGGTTTLPLWIFGASRVGVPAQVNVMGTLIFLVGVVYVVISLLRARRAERPVPGAEERLRIRSRQEVTVRQ